MLNNPWFRVKIAKTVDPITQEVSLQFEHPTLAGMHMHLHIPPPPLHLAYTILNACTNSVIRLAWKVTECSITRMQLTELHRHVLIFFNKSTLNIITIYQLRKSKWRLDAKDERASCSNDTWCVRRS